MIPCVNQATVLPMDTLEFIREARKVGFRLVELDITKLDNTVQQHGLSKLKETISSVDIGIVSLNAIENFPILTSKEVEESLGRCQRIFQLSRELGCEIVVVNPNEYNLPKKRETERAFDSFIEQAARLSSELSVNLGYEFVAYDNRIVNTLAESLKGLARWDSNQIGLVLDLFHLYRTGEEISQIPRDVMNRVWAFHVNDAPPMPISVLKDTDRVFPGKGVVNVQKYLDGLERAGFNGPISLELFNHRYWERPGSQVLQESWDALERLLRSKCH